MNTSILYEYNPWWVNPDSIDDDRNIKTARIESPRKEYSFQDNNLLLIGPRQVGKTTYMKLVIRDLIKSRNVDPKQVLYFSFDDLNHQNIRDLIDTYRSIPFPRRNDKIYFFFDEITSLDSWNIQIKALLDLGFFDKNYICLSGSSSVALKKESFPGRNITICKFLPMTFREYVDLFGQNEVREVLSSNRKSDDVNTLISQISTYLPLLNQLFLDYLNSGGFLSSSYRYRKGEDLSILYDLYWNAVLGDVSNANRSTTTAKSIVQGIIKNYSTAYGYNSLAKDMDIPSHLTVKSYLELFESLFFTFSIFQYDRTKKKSLYSHFHKTYFMDPFLYHAARSKLYSGRVDEKIYGALIEGAVASNLLRKYDDITFLSNKKELDFYIPGNDTGIEVKKGIGTARDFAIKDRIRNKVVLTHDTFDLKKEVKLIPASIYLLF
ncbi:MAG: ATP-binding protein [Candidatus Thermoplasmatota archaeon]|nr:ATP-binding protein [Candidatus Thermoplasmatota archaeon]